MALASLSRGQVCRAQCTSSAIKRQCIIAPASRTVRGARGSRQDRNLIAFSTADDQATPASPVAPAAAPAASMADAPATAGTPTEPEETFYEGSGGAPAELFISLLLATTIICIPLSIASIGRRLWIKFRFTNKRVSVINTSPLFKRQVDVAYNQIREIRSVPRALGLWGDMVVFLKDGSRLELVGLEKYKEIKEYMENRMAV